MASYRVPVLKDFNWQPNVKDRNLNEAPGGASKGDRYIVAAAVPSGDDWFGLENHIVTYDGAAWIDDTPSEGWQTWVEDEDAYYVFDGSDWALSADAAQDASIDSLETVASAAIDSIDSLELVDSVNLSTEVVDVASIDLVTSANASVDVVQDASIDSLELVDSVNLSTEVVDVASIDLVTSANIASIDSIEIAKQDEGTYVSEYGAIEFTI